MTRRRESAFDKVQQWLISNAEVAEDYRSMWHHICQNQRSFQGRDEDAPGCLAYFQQLSKSRVSGKKVQSAFMLPGPEEVAQMFTLEGCWGTNNGDVCVAWVGHDLPTRCLGRLGPHTIEIDLHRRFREWKK